MATRTLSVSPFEETSWADAAEAAVVPPTAARAAARVATANGTARPASRRVRATLRPWLVLRE